MMRIGETLVSKQSILLFCRIPHTDVHLFYSDESDKDGIAQWTSSLGLQVDEYGWNIQVGDSLV